VRVRASTHYLPMLSAHADRDELLRWCRAPPGDCTAPNVQA
jgi:hypothetical protein